MREKSKKYREVEVRNSWSSVLALVLTVGAFVLGSAKVAGHPPEDLMKVQFILSDEALICEAEVHFSQVYALKRKRGGEVSEDDYPAIERSISMNCPVVIDGKEVAPEITEFLEIGETWGKQYLDHPLEEDERLLAKVILRYPLPMPASSVNVTWGMIPRSVEQLEIGLQVDGTTEVFKITQESTGFSWGTPPQSEEPQPESISKQSSSQVPKKVSASSPPKLLWIACPSGLFALIFGYIFYKKSRA